MTKRKSAESKVQPGTGSTGSTLNGIIGLQIKQFEFSQLVPAKYNPRTISDDALAGLAESIKKFGCVEPIIVNVRSGRNTIVGGNQRFRVLSAAGFKEAICITVDLSEADEKLLNLELNNPYIQGGFISRLKEYIDEIEAGIPDSGDLLNLRIQKLREEINRHNIEHIYQEEVLKPYKKTHVLISFSPELLPRIAEYLEAIIKMEGIEYEQGSN